uniref:Chloroplast protein-transporting ATPase n=1 Tax=Plectus sambesii TaxID=2011161 RepID=A0A914UYQ2_9BILA
MTPPTVGIDLGTTYSVVAAYQNAKIQILPNNQSTRKSTTTSCVSYGDNELLIGDPAKKKLVSNHGNVIYDMKRLIGKSYTDPTVEKSKKYWNFKLEPNGEGSPVIDVKYLGKTRQIRPEDVSARVLERMAAVAGEALGETPTKAVIAVPVYFNQAQKQATLDAAQRAGLEVPELITEPAAAAYAFTFDRNQLNGNYNLLVYDFGGGTFDVVVVTVDNGNVKIKAIGGDTHLGGRDIDDRLSDHVSNTIKQKCGHDCTSTRRNKAKLMQKVEEMKIELSNTLETSAYMGDLFTEIDEKITITRGELESLCEDIFVNTIELTKETLNGAKMSPNDIEEVLLVGGSTRIPRVQQLLRDLFPGRTLNQTIDPDEAVAYGAAIRAAQIDGIIKVDITLTKNKMYREELLLEISEAIEKQNATLNDILEQIGRQDILNEMEQKLIEDEYVKILIEFVIKEFQQLFQQHIINKRNENFIEKFAEICEVMKNFDDLDAKFDATTAPFYDKLREQKSLLNETTSASITMQIRAAFWMIMRTSASSAQIEAEMLKHLIESFQTGHATKIIDGLREFHRSAERPNLAEYMRNYFESASTQANPEPVRRFLQSLRRTTCLEFILKRQIVGAIEAYFKPVLIEIQKLRNRMVVIVRGSAYRLSDYTLAIEEQLQTYRQTKNVEEVRLLATFTLWIDSDLENDTWHGVNIVVLAGRVIVDKKCKWNLSGHDSVVTYSLARNGQEPGENGADGEHGFAGESGGNVAIVTDFMDNAERLTVWMNGGSGSSGQSGGNGAKGRDGVGITIDQLRSDFPSPIKITDFADEQLLFDNIANLEGEHVESWVSDSNGLNRYSRVKLSNGQEVEFSYCRDLWRNMFIVYRGSHGQNGGFGGLNGIGGKGGYHGDCLAVCTRAVVQYPVKTYNRTGTNGSDGMPGKNGEYGKNAWDVGYMDYRAWSAKIKISHIHPQKIDVTYSKNKSKRVYCAYRYDKLKDKACYAALEGKPMPQRVLKDNEKNRERCMEKPQQIEATRKNALLLNEIISTHESELQAMVAVRGEMAQLGLQAAATIGDIQQQVNKVNEELERLKGKTMEQISQYHTYKVKRKRKKPEKTAAQLRADIETKKQCVMNRIEENSMNTDAWEAIFDLELSAEEINSLIKLSSALNGPLLQQFEKKQALAALMYAPFELLHVNANAMDTIIQDPSQGSRFLKPTDGVAKNNWTNAFHLAEITDERIEGAFNMLKALQIPSDALDEFEDNVSKLLKMQINDTQRVSDIMEHRTKMNESQVKGVMEELQCSIFSDEINEKQFAEAFNNIEKLRVDYKALKDLLPDTEWREIKSDEMEVAHFLINIESAINELHYAKKSLQCAIGYFAKDAWAANKHQHLSCVQSYERFVFCVNFRIEMIKSTLAELEYCPLLKQNWRCYEDDFKPQSMENRELTAREQKFINALHENRIDLRRRLVNEISSTQLKQFDWSNVLQYGIDAQTTDACLNEMIDQKIKSRALLELLAYTNRQPINIFARNENKSLKHVGNFFHLGGEPQFAELVGDSLVEMTVDGKKFILELTRDAFVKHMQKAVSDNPHLMEIAQSKNIEQTVTNICCDIYKRLKTEIIEKIYRYFEKTPNIADVVLSALNLTKVSDRSETSPDVPICDEFIFNVRRELKRQKHNLSNEESDQLDGKLRKIHQEAERLNKIDNIKQRLLKLIPAYMGPNMLLSAIEQIFECNGMQMSLDELRIFIDVVLNACTMHKQHPDLFTSIILTTPQDALVDQIILHVFENQSKQLLQNRWKLLQHLRNLEDLSLKKVLLQKIAESTEMPSEENFSSILELLKHYENKDAQHLLRLELIDWAGSLRENYWKEQLQLSQSDRIRKWDHCAFYFVRLDSFYDRKLVEKLLSAIEGIAPYIDEKMLLKFLYQLYSEELDLRESVTIDLITLTEQLQKSSRSVSFLSQQNGVQLDDEQVEQLKERLGLVIIKERKIAQLVGMIRKPQNAIGIHSLLDTIQLLIQDHFSMSHEIRNEEDLINVIEEAKRTLPEADDKHVHLLQVVNAAIRYKRRYELRDTQKLVILASLKNQRGLLSQVSTGEGKTLIIMSIAIIKCMLGEQVDIITSCSVLARRDAESAPPKGNSDIYKLFGIAVGHNCVEDAEKRAHVYNTCDVVYGDLSSFQRDYLLDTFYGKNILGRHRRLNVIVDEVDSMLLDNGNNMLYLSHDIPAMDRLQSLLIYIWKRVNRPIKSAKEFSEYSNKVIIQAIIADLHGLILQSDLDSVTWKKLKKNGLIGDDGRLQKQLRDYSEEVEKLEIGDQSKRDQLIFLLNSTANRIRDINIPDHLFQFVENHLDSFINSAKTAMYMEHGVNYVIDIDRTGQDPDRNPKIIIINQDTGTDESSSQWHNALHQFLQLKHDCKLTMIGLKAVFISNVSYFKMYQNIYGLSGTLGSKEEKQLLSKLYNVDLIKVPTCKPKNFYEEGPLIASNTHMWMDNLFKATCNKLQENRSVLIVAESVRNVEYIEKQLKQRFNSNKIEQNATLSIGFQQIHVYKREHEEFRFGQGNDELACAQVIVATNLAGRGTDIKLCQELITKGGLHVIVTFLPNNSRVEEQAYGRSARCGEPGTGQLVIMNDSVDENATFMAKIFQLKNMRDAEELIRLKSIIKHYEERTVIEEKCFSQFQQKYEQIEHQLGEQKYDEKRMRIILNSCLDAWAYWLNEQSDIIDNAATRDPKNKKLFDNLENFLKPINSEVKKWNRNPLQFLKLAIYNLEHKCYEDAEELLTKIKNEHQYFEAEALFYQAFMFIRQNGAKLNSTTTIEFGKLQQMLSRSKQLFEARIDECSRDQAFVQSFKTETNQLIHIEAFTEQQQTICQIYSTFINSINELQGQAVSSNAFVSIKVNDLLAKDIFWHLQENAKIITDYMVSPYLEESNKTDVTSVAADYGIDSETLWNVVSNRKSYTINSDLLEQKIALPSIEDFWELLISNGVLMSEEEFFEVDTTKLDQLQLNRRPPMEQFRYALDIDSMDGKQILMYRRRKQQMERESKVFCSMGLRNVMNSIDANLEESLKRYGILQLNRIATINTDRLKSPLSFPRFDSFQRDYLTALGISLNEADRLLKALVASNVLEESSFQGVYALKGELNLDEVSAVYQGVVAAALNNHFAYQIKLRQLREHFDENEQSEMKTPPAIKLASHPHASLLFDLVDKGIVHLPKVNYDILKNSTIKNILSSLKMTIALGKDVLSEKATSEAIESTLTQLVCVLQKMETPDCVFSNIIELMKLQPGSSLTEVAWFSMNGCDKLISTVDKEYSTKMWTNMLIITGFAMAQIVAGIMLEIFTVGAGTIAACAVIYEGISDLLFVGSSLASGYCKMTDYWQYKKFSVMITTTTGGLAGIVAGVTKVSFFGYKVVGPAGEVVAKKIFRVGTKMLVGYLGNTIKRSYRKRQETIMGAGFDRAKQEFDDKVSNDKMYDKELEQEREQYHSTLMKLMSRTRDASLLGDVLREGVQMDVTCVQACTDVIHKMMCQIDSKFKGIKIIIEEEDGVQRTYESGKEATHIITLKLENSHFTVGGELERATASIDMNNCLFHALAAEISVLHDVFSDSNAFRETLANVISMDDHMKFIIRKDWHRNTAAVGIDDNSVCIAFNMKKNDAEFGLNNKEYDKLFEKLQASGLLHGKQSVTFLTAQSAADTAAEARGPHAAMQILSFWQKNHKKWLTKGNSKTGKSPPKLGASRPVCMCCGFALRSMQISFNVYAKATTKPSNWRDPANIRTTAYIRNVIKRHK